MGQILTHHVTKKFEDDGLLRQVGECVNALAWRTAEALEKQRYIHPLPEGVEPVPDSEGRFWLSQEWLDRYGREPLSVEPEEGAGGEAPAYPKRLKGVGRWELSDQTVLQGVKRSVAEKAERALGAPG